MAVFGYDFFMQYYDIDFQFFLLLTFHSFFSHSRTSPALGMFAYFHVHKTALCFACVEKSNFY
jgi:hypothetical protein